MPPSSQIVSWAALPQGISNGLLRVSIFIAPRLSVDSSASTVTLDEFADFKNWPNTVGSLSLALEFKAKATSATSIVLRETDPIPLRRLSSPSGFQNPWLDLLNDFPRVNSFDSNKSKGRKIISFDGKTLTDTVLQRFSGQRSPDEMTAQALRKDDQFGDVVKVLAAMDNLQQEAKQRLDTLRSTEPQTPPAGFSRAQWNVALVRYFADRQSTPPPATTTTTTTPGSTTTITEFHELFAALSNYPWVMRQLSFIVDLELPTDAINQVPNAGLLRVVTARANDACPWTAYQLDTDNFLAAARRVPDETGTGQLTEIQNGMLALRVREQSGEFVHSVTQLDPLAEGLKLIDFAADVSTGPETKRLSFPALRSSGCALMRTRLAQRVGDLLDKVTSNNALLNSGKVDEIQLFAQDLTRGYRVDVRDEESKRWFSLCERDGKYKALKTQQTLNFQDEGWVTIAGTIHDQDLGIHETLFRWDGWSLCTPRPGLGLMRGGNLGSGDEDSSVYNKMLVSLNTPKKRLPRLRFGKSYRFRVRLADLTGGGVSLGEAKDDLTNATDVFKSGRLEPVPPPLVLLRRQLDSIGSSARHVVTRSNKTLVDICVDEPEDPNSEEWLQQQRHLVPPKTSQWLAESHGMFDLPNGLDASAWSTAARDTALSEVEDHEEIDIVYLPDPLAGVALLRGVPGSEKSFELPFWSDAAEWRNPKGWRIAVQRGAYSQESFVNDPVMSLVWPDAKDPSGNQLKSKIDRRKLLKFLPASKKKEYGLQLAKKRCKPGAPKAKDGLLTISLPPATVAEIQLSAKITADALSTMAYWHQIEISSPAEAADIQKQILSGVDERFTPASSVSLVHAVQRPLYAPEFQLFDYGSVANRLVAKRERDDTTAELIGAVSFPGESASKLDLMGTWDETVDDVLETKPVTRTQTQLLNSRQVADPVNTVLPIRCVPNFGNTKYRKVTCTTVAASRFQEYFDPAKIADGTLAITQTSDPVEVVIPNSARPPAPEVDYVVPIFGWSSWQTVGSTNAEVKRSRLGGGLRVYLRRPWIVSGEGELLAVILYLAKWEKSVTQPNLGLFHCQPDVITHAVGPSAEEFRHVADQFTSICGSDSSRSQAEAGSLKLSDFTNRIQETSKDSIALPELSEVKVPYTCLANAIVGSKPNGDPIIQTQLTDTIEVSSSAVAIAAHEVHFDPDRNLWFSDIRITGQQNSPFVRLALARYQPNSLTGLHLSTPVLTDFVQLPSDREVTFVRKGTSGGTYTVTLRGDFTQESVGTMNTSLEVTTEILPPGAAGDDLDWVVKATTPLTIVSDSQGVRFEGDVHTETGGRNRFVIREYEESTSDSGNIRRIVFADVRCL